MSVAMPASQRQQARDVYRASMDAEADVRRDLATVEIHAGYEPPADEQPLGTYPCRCWSQAGRGRDARPDGDPTVNDYRMTVPVDTDLQPGDVVTEVRNTTMNETIVTGRLIVRDVLRRSSYLIATLEQVT